MHTFLWWIEAFVVFPAGLVSIGFGGVAEARPVRVDSRKLAEFLPCPVCVVVAEMLDITAAMRDVETRLRLVPHHNARGQERCCPERRCGHLGRI